MSETNVFGPVVTGGMLERAVIEHLVGADEITGGNWLSTALGEIERLEGLPPNSVQRPLAVVTSSEFEKMTEVPLPCVLVITPGLTERPTRQGDGTLALKWGVGIAAIVGDTDENSTRRIGQAYAAAISLAVMRHKSLGIGAKTTFMDERYDDLDFADGRTLGAGRCVFEIEVANARTTRGGPMRPLPEPDPDGTGGPGTDPGPWPGVTETSVDVELKPITEEVRT